MINGNNKYDLAPPQRAVSYGDDYDDVSELVDLPLGSHSGLPADSTGASGANGGKNIRRRSSKGVSALWGFGPIISP
jgi:hypothetical protein